MGTHHVERLVFNVNDSLGHQILVKNVQKDKETFFLFFRETGEGLLEGLVRRTNSGPPFPEHTFGVPVEGGDSLKVRRRRQLVDLVNIDHRRKEHGYSGQ